jgi:hypothetical protein
MARKESEARAAKVEKEIATKVGKELKEKSPAQFAKRVISLSHSNRKY